MRNQDLTFSAQGLERYLNNAATRKNIHMKILSTIAFLFTNFLSSAETDVNFNASYEPSSASIIIRWQNNPEKIRSFTLQKSYDNVRWQDIHTLPRSAFGTKTQEKFEDRNPGKQNFYRLKMDYGNIISYSDIIMIQPGASFKTWKLYYPGTNFIYLEYQGARTIEGVISVYVRNLSGNALVRKRFSPMDRKLAVPIDNLGRGIYIVSIVLGNETIWSQQFSR